MLGREQDDSQTFGTGPWCWVKCDSGKTSKSLLYMLLTGKAFEIQCYIYTATLYCLLKWKMYIARRFRSLNEVNPDLRDDDKNFLFVWLMLLSIRIWGTIRFLMRAIPEDYSKVSPNMTAVDNVFVYMQAAGDPAQAFCNFILFCLLDNEVRVKLKRFVFCRASQYENVDAIR
ncbi:GP157-like protein [Mya arenaria]|uniref:GP157-like protein n=2 Tax=Mya arenaria TaxID=6604 RepID=A0ABY7EZD5_MYAAR|nr:GP157-like protein [Mya arenaria]